MSVGAVNKQTGDRIPTAGMPAIDDALDLTSTNPVQNAIITAALANKQDKTDNNLETTSKTVVGAVNELRSGLTNYQAQNDLNLEVPDRKNLLNYDAWSRSVYGIKCTVVTENNGATLTSTNSDAYTVYKADEFPRGARVPVKVGDTITLSWVEESNKSGGVFIFGDNNAVLANVNNKDYKKVSCTIPNGITFVTFRLGVSDAGETISYKNIQIEMGTTATAYAPYIPSVESRIEAVESGTVLKTVNVSPVAGHGITVDDGGVYRVGDLVIVQIKFTTTDATTDFFYGLPHPKQTGSTTLINLLSGDGTLFNVNASGFLRSASRPAGTYSCTGVYVTDAS